MSALPLALLIGAVFALLSATAPIADPDVFWHLRLGQRVLSGSLERADTWSWTAAGAPLALDQWLGQALLALAHQWAGWSGLVIVRAFSGGAVLALAVLTAAREGTRPIVVVLACLPAMLLVRGVWTERPQLFGLVLFAALVLVLREALRGRSTALYAAVPILAVWANVHGSYALGLAMLVPVALATRRRTGLIAGALAIGATLLTPAGLGTGGAPASHLLAPPRYIQEWALPDPTTPAGVVYALLLSAIAGVAFFGRPAWREALILVPVVLVSLTAVRHAAFLAVAAAPFLAACAPAALGRLGAAVGPDPRRAPLPRPIGAAALAIAAIAAGAAVVVAPDRPSLDAYPVAALPALRAGPGLVNEYDWGGFLIWYAPDTPVFVDGRLTPYVPATVSDLTTILEARPGWRETLARLGVRQLLVRPESAVAVRARELGWRLVVAGPRAVVIDVP